jgi:predicted Zn-dependent protease
LPPSAPGFDAAVAALRAPAGVALSVRLVEEESRTLSVLRGVLQPLASVVDCGAMVTAWLPGGTGYCATADLRGEGLQAAADRAVEWARASARSGLLDGIPMPRPDAAGLRREPPGFEPLPPDEDLAALLHDEAAALRRDERIVHWCATLRIARSRQRLHFDGRFVAEQESVHVEPNLEATAAGGARAQTRTLAGHYNGFCQQGGFDVIRRSGLPGGGQRVGEEALQLLAAPNCPSGRMSLLLMPDQMMLQIHESIGHPLELDRILGDERNFAGGSFVTPGMFGSYRYGSELLNVSFDPARESSFSGYAADDEGMRARRTMLIERGLLLRPLGGALSQARARAAGFALEAAGTARASGWYRAPIDRMANLDVEPGDTPLAEMIAGVERGVLMRTNASWSIDDSRNKFQFGCEWGQLIEDGRLGAVVRNPNYRGTSASFWRSLARVGDRDSFEVMGTPFCGKGEPGQVIRVGHSAPACLFDGVDVFGAEG